VLVNGRELPDNLPSLLSEMQEAPFEAVIGKLRLAAVFTTRALLELSREQWFGERGKCFVPGCAGIRGPLDRYLTERWEAPLGALAASVEAPARGPPARAGPRPGRPTVLDTFDSLADFARGDT
jgi:hypothetical protein